MRPINLSSPDRASLGDVSRRDLVTGALAGAAAFAASTRWPGRSQRGRTEPGLRRLLHT